MTDFSGLSEGQLLDKSSLQPEWIGQEATVSPSERMLQRSESYFRLLVENATEVIMVVNQDYVIRDVSPAMAQVLGYSLDALIGRNTLEFVHPDDRDNAINAFQDTLQNPEIPQPAEFRLRHQNGAWQIFEAVGKNLVDNPIIAGVVLNLRDITERKQIEALMAGQNRVLEMVARGAPLPHVLNILTQLMEQQSTTEIGCSILLLDEGGKNLWAGAVTSFPDTYNQAINGMAIGPSAGSCGTAAFRGETVIVSNIAADPLWARNRAIALSHGFHACWSTPIFSTAGKVLGTFAIYHREPRNPHPRDLQIIRIPAHIAGIAIELRRTQEAMQKLNVELEQRVRDRTLQLEVTNRELEAFSYSVSHDLRAPLRSIEGFSKILQDRYTQVLDAQGQHYLERVRSGAQRMAELIEDLLKLSRITRSQLRSGTVNLSALAQTVIDQLQASQPDRGVEVAIAPQVTAYGDARLLQVVLENLLGNAWKFTAKQPHPQIEFSTLQQPDGQLTYYVRDNGAGFNMKAADQLFGAFQRMHPASEFPGTGIGLATVQRIIHRHGGRIWAESAVDQGASFYFTLPNPTER